MKEHPDNISYVVHEATIARFQDEIDRMEKRNREEQEREERRFKALVGALIVSIVLIFGSNVGWLIYESMYDTVSYAQDGAGVNNINTGKQGDVTREPEIKDQAAQKR